MSDADTGARADVGMDGQARLEWALMTIDAAVRVHELEIKRREREIGVLMRERNRVLTEGVAVDENNATL